MALNARTLQRVIHIGDTVEIKLCDGTVVTGELTEIGREHLLVDDSTIISVDSVLSAKKNVADSTPSRSSTTTPLPEKKLRESIRKHTHRANGHSLEYVIAKINPILRGWFGYFKHSYQTEFPGIDGWVRMRLRSILRKRHQRRGRARGTDHQRWPNKYFSERGLFSLTAAHQQLCKPPLG